MVIKHDFALRSSVRMALAGMLLASLAACGLQNPTVDTLINALPSGSPYAGLPSGFSYLALELDGRSAVMALGTRRVEGVAPFEDVTESWYNGQGEMLVLRNGRIHLAIGLAQEWRNNQSKPPQWRDVAASDFAIAWPRQLDRMPGYRFDVPEQITTRRIPTPKDAPKAVPPSAQWFADEVRSQTRQTRPWQFTQRFAVVDQRVVYSEQCVSETVCLKLRPLAVVEK